jgi:hypothetical protein
MTRPSEHVSRDLTRRGILLGGAALLATACTNDAGTTGAPSSAPSTTPSATSTPTVTAPPVPQRYTAASDEVQPALKQVAARFVERLGTYGPDRSALERDGYPPGTLDRAMPLLRDDTWSRMRTQFVQLGGLRPVSGATYASAMVVAEQTFTRTDGRTRSVVRVVDVRVRLEGGRWVVGELASVGGTKVTRGPRTSASARAVLDDRRLVMPDSARWDVAEGIVDDRLLRLMSNLADSAPVTVTVLRSGHPTNVIDDRAAGPVSAHTLGRAVDIWAVDGVPVRRMSDADIRAFGQRAFADPDVAQVGVPRGLDLDGAGPRSFENEVHDDHIHVAVRA